MKKLQPKGPYALLGYSYGGTLALELAKGFEQAGDEVKFLGVIDQPPSIKMRMHYSNWTNVVLTLAAFLDIIDDKYAAEIYRSMSKLSNDAVLDHILSCTTPAHVKAVAITKQKLSNWALLALNKHTVARDYEPTGKVQSLDVFYAAAPDVFYANSSDEMLEKHIGKWESFVETTPRFHRVSGTPNDMIRPVHVAGL